MVPMALYEDSGYSQALYTSLLTSDKLNGYLADIDRQPTKIILKKQGQVFFLTSQFL